MSGLNFRIVLNDIGISRLEVVGSYASSFHCLLLLASGPVTEDILIFCFDSAEREQKNSFPIHISAYNLYGASVHFKIISCLEVFIIHHQNS